VRIWKEPESGRSSGLLRGSARQLRTGEERFFKSLDELSSHLLGVLAVVPVAGREEDSAAGTADSCREVDPPR